VRTAKPDDMVSRKVPAMGRPVLQATPDPLTRIFLVFIAPLSPAHVFPGRVRLIRSGTNAGENCFLSVVHPQRG